jgi:ribonuclease P protein component
VLAGGKVAATAHFVLHRCVLNRGTSGPGQPPIDLQSKATLFSPPDVWLGAMVPKRWAKRAVTRNSIKRQIYNVSSEFESVLPVAAHVVRLRSGFDRSSFVSASSDALKAAVRGELLQLFSNAAQVVTAVRTSGAPP